MEKGILIKKLTGTSGESLAEALASVLMCALSLTMLLGMITAAVGLSKQGTASTDNIRKEEEKLIGILNGNSEESENGNSDEQGCSVRKMTITADNGAGIYGSAVINMYSFEDSGLSAFLKNE